jgi:hypothetical protein
LSEDIFDRTATTSLLNCARFAIKQIRLAVAIFALFVGMVTADVFPRFLNLHSLCDVLERQSIFFVIVPHEFKSNRIVK